MKPIGEVAKIESGGNASQNENYFINVKHHFVRAEHLSDGVCVDKSDFINDSAVRNYKLEKYPIGSIVVQKSGESLKKGRVNILPFDTYAVNHLAIFDPITNERKLWYIFFTLKQILNELIESQSDISLPYIRLTDIQSKCALLPLQHILQRFYSLVKPLFQKIILNQKEIMVLRQIRDSLLPQLVFEKLRVVEI